jgi:glycerol-3-phosphate dehydrogenase
MKPAWTHDAVLPGGDLPRGDREAWLAELARRYPDVPRELVHAIAHRHGTRAAKVLGDARTGADLGNDFGAGLTEREIEFLRDDEWAMSADDILWRRTKCGLAMTKRQRERVASYVEGARG